MPNDTQLWKGFNGHGLYAQRAERDRDGNVIDETYARKADLHALSDSLSDSTTTELTPHAAKTAIDGILKAPTPGAEGTMLSYGVSQNSMAWDSWESAEVDLPSILPDHCVLLDYLIDGFHLGQERDMNYASYPAITGYAPNTDTKDGFAYFDFSGAPFKQMPYAYFNNTIGEYNKYDKLRWDGFTAANYPDGVTVEFLARVDSNATFCQFVDLLNAYNFGGISGNNSQVGSYQVVYDSASFNYYIGNLSAILNSYDTGDAWHHYCYTADFKNRLGCFFLDGVLVSIVSNNKTASGELGFTPCCIDTRNGSAKTIYGYWLAQVAVWDYAKYTESFTIPRKPLIVH